MKFKKIITIALVMVVSAIGITVSAESDETVAPVDKYKVEIIGDQMVITAIICPGDVLTNEGIMPLDNGVEVLPRSTYIGVGFARDFYCYATYGNRLNVWVQNNGCNNVKAVLKTRTYTNSYIAVPSDDRGALFKISSNDGSGMEGTYTLDVAAATDDGSEINVTTKARQFFS